MLLLIFFSVFYASVEPTPGIVKHVLETDGSWPDEGTTRYTHILECDYRHHFPQDQHWTYTYDIHCMKVTTTSGAIEHHLSINYDNNVFDIFTVSSCEKDKVIKSVFPPLQKQNYDSGDLLDHLGRPTISYIKYITEEGLCFSRKYQFENRKATAATRSNPEKIDCEGEPGLSKYGQVAEFTNCRATKLPLSPIVTGWSSTKPTWVPNDAEGKKHKQHLICTFDQFSQLYGLVCVQGDKPDEYFAFMYYYGRLIDRLTVSTCDEEQIVNGIFMVKETNNNPKRREWIEKIFFAYKDGKCYRREYPNFELGGDLVDPQIETCPTYPDEWTNPSWGKAGHWRECRKPKDGDDKSQPKEKSEEDVAKKSEPEEKSPEEKHDKNKD